MINRIKSTLLMAFCVATLLASFGAFSASSTAYAVPNDDEKEETQACSNPDKLQVYCTQGEIDCRPKNCA